MKRPIVGLAVAVIFTVVVLPVSTAAAATPVPVHIFTFNDYHGRVNTSTNTTTGVTTGALAFAAALEQAVLADPTNSLVVSAGDNIGASEFESFIDQDNPTLQLLNDLAAALPFPASSVGNHEFDQGLTDLTGRVQSTATGWEYLCANCLDTATMTPVLSPYLVSTLGNGIRVGIVAAVTQDVASLVSLAGIATLTFTDPVAAVNQYADYLKANNLADIVIAVYHDGSPVATTFADATAVSPRFADMVTRTDANVAAIVNGHTHMTYAWTDATGRPVVQAGSYGATLGKIDLVVDTDTMTVMSATPTTLPTAQSAPINLTLGNLALIKTHLDAAVASASVLGSQPVAEIAADITTAHLLGVWAPGTFLGQGATTYQNTGTATRDDRPNESSLARLAADAFLDTANSSDAIGGADIGIINAGGGLRAELLYAPDGVVTYSEANKVMPFGNNLWTIELTGAQLKQFLEEQWWADASGNPLNTFRNTGVSSNVTYTVNTDVPTAPPCTLQICSWTAPESHITSVFINGAPLVADKVYKIVTLSFLTAGSDNYWVMKQGTNPTDTGLLDRDAWIGYLAKLSNLAGTTPTPIVPSFARPSVVVSNLSPAPAPMGPAVVTAGGTVTAALSRLDLTSLGSPANTELYSYLLPMSAAGAIPTTGVPLGSVPITLPGDAAGCAAVGVPAGLNPASNGCAGLSVVIPAGTAPGDYLLVSVAAPSGTTVSIWLTVKAPAILVDSGGTVAHTDAVALLLLLMGLPMLAVLSYKGKRY